jgi:hypothetical protein
MRDIGGAGESFFGAWCASAGMTANRSESDVHGWDMLIEVDYSGDSLHPLHLHEGMSECKIQIKSTDGQKRHVDVELSNLKKLATTLMPAFYVLLEFDGNHTPVKAFIKHIDQPKITKILRRIREVTAADPKAKLNKKKMRVHFEDEIYPLTPIELKSKIQNYIGKSNSAYVRTKSAFLSTTGFDGPTHKINFSIKDQTQLQRLIDANLGQSEQIQVQVHDVSAFVTRFGVSTEIPELKTATAIMRFENIEPQIRGKMTFRNARTGYSASFDADIYRGISDLVPLNYRKLRLVSGLLEFTLTGDRKANLLVNLSSNEKYELEELLKLLKVCTALATHDDMELNIQIANQCGTLNLHSPRGFEDCSHQLLLIEDFLQIKNYFSWHDALPLNMEQVESQAEEVVRAKNLIFRDPRDLTLNFPAAEGPPIGTMVDSLYLVKCEIGNYIFADLLKLRGEVQAAENDQNQVKIANRHSIYKTAIENTEDGFSFLQRGVERAISELETDLSTINFTPIFFTRLTNTKPA